MDRKSKDVDVVSRIVNTESRRAARHGARAVRGTRGAAMHALHRVVGAKSKSAYSDEKAAHSQNEANNQEHHWLVVI